MELTVPFSIASLSDFPCARRCSCPTNSSSVLGRMRAARGWAVSRALQRLSSLEPALESGRRNFLGILGFNGCKALAEEPLGVASMSKGYTDAPDWSRILWIRSH